MSNPMTVSVTWPPKAPVTSAKCAFKDFCVMYAEASICNGLARNLPCQDGNRCNGHFSGSSPYLFVKLYTLASLQV